MDRIRIVGGNELSGNIPISGAKNAALPLMIASLLTDGTLTLENVPQIVIDPAATWADPASIATHLLVGSPSVVCGPGDIAQAHTADEWIEKSELDRCMAFISRLADWAES